VDTKQLSQLYDGHLEKIYRFFFYKVLNREIAEDLTSQTFLAFAKESQNRDDIENPRSFLYGIAKHVFLGYLRDKYKTPEISIDVEEFEDYIDEEIKSTNSGKDILDKLTKLLPQLPPKQRHVMRMRFIDKLSIPEICKILNKDANYVSKTQQRGLQSLRKILNCTDDDTNIIEKSQTL
jgi:RNA polymerase sigma-70 factor (ECF subfamily)